MISPGNQPDMLVDKSKKPNESQASATRLDIPNVLPTHFARTPNKSQPQSNRPPSLEAAVVLNVKCNCSKVEYDTEFISQGLHCMHTVHCYELPMKFSFLPNSIAAATIDDVGDGATTDRKYLADQKRWWPPPIFIILVSLLEVSIYNICI